MKHLILTLTLLLVGSLKAQTFNFSCSNPYTDKYNITDTSSVTAYYDAFVSDALSYGVTIPTQTYTEIVVLSDEVYDHSSSGRASLCDGDQIIVHIKSSFWEGANLEEKFALMYHEFGHGIFDLDHHCDSREIMNTRATSFTEACGDDYIATTDVSESKYTYSGFQASIKRMFLDDNQNHYACANKRTGGVIVYE